MQIHRGRAASSLEARARLLERAAKPAWKGAVLNRVFENALTLARAGERLRR